MSLQDIYQAVMSFNKNRVSELVQAEIAGGARAQDILLQGLIAPLSEVGKKFSAGEMFVPEMLASAYAMKAGLVHLRPLLAAEGSDRIGKILIGTVKGDLHDIGKNIVAMMLEGGGFEVVDLGVDVEAEEFVVKCKELKPDIIALSALLTTTMPAMKKTVALIRQEWPDVKIIVGGAPITSEFAQEIGADAYGEDAPEAVVGAKRLMGMS